MRTYGDGESDRSWADGERVSVGQEIRVVRPQVLTAHLEVVLAGWKVGPFTEAGEKGN